MEQCYEDDGKKKRGCDRHILQVVSTVKKKRKKKAEIFNSDVPGTGGDGKKVAFVDVERIRDVHLFQMCIRISA